MSDNTDRTTTPSDTEDTVRAPVGATNNKANVNAAMSTGGI